MTVANVAQGSDFGLPQSSGTAQACETVTGEGAGRYPALCETQDPRRIRSRVKRKSR